jgi:hypothetical protein
MNYKYIMMVYKKETVQSSQFIGLPVQQFSM